jgi:hypothetical protein
MSADVEKFIGAWRLLSLEARSSPGDVSYPFGKDAAGYLLYTREGYMSASVMQARRVQFPSLNALAAPAGEKVAAFDTYSSYSGRYEVRGEKILHHVEVSSFPNWSGRAQERFFAFSGDQLTLTAPPMQIGGVEQRLVAIWQRLHSHTARCITKKRTSGTRAAIPNPARRAMRVARILVIAWTGAHDGPCVRQGLLFERVA